MFIEAGRSILRQEGLAVGGEALKLKRVSDQVEADFGIWCTNASITGRLWDTQSEYQADVLVTIAADDSNSEVAASLDRMTSFIANMDTSSHAARPWSLRELCRKVSVVHLDTLRNSTDWSFWIGIWAITAVGSAPERRQRIDEALRQSYLDVTDQMEAIYSSLLAPRLSAAPWSHHSSIRYRFGGADRRLRPTRPGRFRADGRHPAADGAQQC
jgi:hypothetical protein